MPPSFKQLILEATRRTRAGDLHGATALIREAMRGGGVASPSHPSGPIVVDAEVVSVTPGGRAPSAVLEDATSAATTAAAREAAPAATAQPTAARATAQPAAVPAEDAGRFVAGRFGSGPLARDFKLFVPPRAWSAPPLGDATQALRPLVVLLHGCKQDPDDFARGTAMNEAAIAADEPFFVLYPAQARNANIAKCWNWFKATDQVRGGGEAGVIAAMTRDVIERYPVDPRRVYVAGLSAGGAMAAILGDAYPDLFAAVGVHSGLPTGAASDVQSAFSAMKQGGAAPRPGMRMRAAPIIVFHGDRDATVHPVNGEHVIAARTGNAAAEETNGLDGRAWTRRIWRDDAGRVIAEHWRVHGAGHAWSGGRPAGSFTDPSGPSATREMLRFFLEHPRADAPADGTPP